MNIFCPNCENECSAKAMACPKCGHPLSGAANADQPVVVRLWKQKSWDWWRYRIVAVLLIIVFLKVIGASIQSANDEERRVNETMQKQREAENERARRDR